MTRILITGAAGFIGSHVVEHLLKNTDWELFCLDKLSYSSSGLDRLRAVACKEKVWNDRVITFATDISQPIPIGLEKEIGVVNYILHMAAETHVDNSISNPRPFLYANIFGTFEMLQFARRLNSHLKKFIYFSTDEVFGPARGSYQWKEWDRHYPTNPYSATKAAGDMLCMAWANTYKTPTLITHCMNAFGERQHPEKFIPSTVRKILQGEPVVVHMDATKTISGSRSYIHARNIAAAVLFLLNQEGLLSGDKYNIAGEREVSNLDLVYKIHGILEKETGRTLPLVVEKTDFHSSRPGHDMKYALDGGRLKELGWEPPNTFDKSLEKTIRWMISPSNLNWLLMTNKEEVYV